MDHVRRKREAARDENQGGAGSSNEPPSGNNEDSDTWEWRVTMTKPEAEVIMDRSLSSREWARVKTALQDSFENWFKENDVPAIVQGFIDDSDSADDNQGNDNGDNNKDRGADHNDEQAPSSAAAPAFTAASVRAALAKAVKADLGDRAKDADEDFEKQVTKKMEEEEEERVVVNLKFVSLRHLQNQAVRVRLDWPLTRLETYLRKKLPNGVSFDMRLPKGTVFDDLTKTMRQVGVRKDGTVEIFPARGLSGGTGCSKRQRVSSGNIGDRRLLLEARVKTFLARTDLPPLLGLLRLKIKQIYEHEKHFATTVATLSEEELRVVSAAVEVGSRNGNTLGRSLAGAMSESDHLDALKTSFEDAF